MKLRSVNVLRETATRRDVEKTAPLTGILVLKCVTESYLHIGAGKLKFSIDKRIVSMFKKRPDFNFLLRSVKNYAEYEYSEVVRYSGKVVIPGSSLKGCIRSRLELLAVSKDDTTHFCFRVSDLPRNFPPQRGQHGWRHYEMWKPAPKERRYSTEGREECDTTRGDYRVCATCDLFGAPGLASRILFENFYAQKYELLEMELDYYEKVEAIKPGSIFEGRIVFKNLRPYELGLIFIGLGASKTGEFKSILLGKSKYRRRRVVSCLQDKSLVGKEIVFGLVKFRIKAILVNNQIYSIQEDSRKNDFYVYSSSSKINTIVAKAVEEASKKFPELRVDYNEVDVLDKVR